MSKKVRVDSAPTPPRATLAEALAHAGVAVTTLAAPPPPATAKAPGIDLSRAGKIVLRREMKGRGGKTVTVIAGLQMSAAALERTARELRKALGCGSTVEAELILLQGDMTQRAQEWLAARGAARIVVGN